MTINEVIKQLQELKKDLPQKGKTTIGIVEHGFVHNAIQSFVREIEFKDINFEQDISNKDLVYTQEGIKGDVVVVGIIPKYV